MAMDCKSTAILSLVRDASQRVSGTIHIVERTFQNLLSLLTNSTQLG